MGFRSNVQRSGARTARYSGSANLSRKTPLGKASITRAGEVVIKQGDTTTYVPPATFSGGKAAYKRYEAIRSVQGDNAASQMAKEVAQGNAALQTIKPSVESYKKSREASQAYRGVQTISGDISIPVASGGMQQTIQVLQPSMVAERQRNSSPIFSTKNQEVSEPQSRSQPFSTEFLDLIGQKPVVEKRPRFYMALPPELGGKALPEGDRTLLSIYDKARQKQVDYFLNKIPSMRFTEEVQAGLIQTKGEKEAEAITSKYQGVIESEQKKSEDVVKMAEERTKVNLYNVDRNMREQFANIDKNAETKSKEIISAYESQRLGYKTAEEKLKQVQKEQRVLTGKLVLESQEKSEDLIKKYEKEMNIYGSWLPARQSRVQQSYEAELEELSKKYQPYTTEKKQVTMFVNKLGIKVPITKTIEEEKPNPLYAEQKGIVRAEAGIGKGQVFAGQYLRPAISSLDPLVFVSPIGYVAGRTIVTGGREVTEMIKSFKREPLKTAAISGLSIGAYAGVGALLGGGKAALVKSASKVKSWGIKNFFKTYTFKGRLVERTPAAYLKAPKSYAVITGRGSLPKVAIQELPKGFRLSSSGTLIKSRGGRLPSSGNAILYNQKVIATSGTTLKSFVGWKTTGKILYAKSIGRVSPAISSLKSRVPVKVRVVEPSITGYRIVRTPTGRATIPIRTKSAFIELKKSPREFDLRTWTEPKQSLLQKFGVNIKRLPQQEIIDVRYLFNPKYSRTLLAGKESLFNIKVSKSVGTTKYRFVENKFGKALYEVKPTKAFSIKIKKSSPYQDYLQTKNVVFDIGKLGKNIKYKSYRVVDYFRAEGKVLNWFATQGLKNLGKKAVVKGKRGYDIVRMKAERGILRAESVLDKDIRIKVKKTKPARDVASYYIQEVKSRRLDAIIKADIPESFRASGLFHPGGFWGRYLTKGVYKSVKRGNIIADYPAKNVFMINGAKYYNVKPLLGSQLTKGNAGYKNIIILDNKLFGRSAWHAKAQNVVGTHEAIHYALTKSKVYPKFLKSRNKFAMNFEEFITMKGEGLYKMGLLKFMGKEKALNVKLTGGRAVGLLLKRGVKPVQQPAFSIKLVNKGGRVKRINLFRVNIGKKLYESAMTRKGRKFKKMYSVAKEQAGLLPKQEWKLKSWLESSERAKILKSWARTSKKGKTQLFYEGKVYTLEEMNYRLRHMREWESAHEMSRYAGGGVESNVDWAKVPDVLTGKKGSAVFKVPVIHANVGHVNVGSASSLGIGSASLGGLLWKQRSASGLVFKPESLSDLRIKQEQLRVNDSVFDVSQREKFELVPVSVPKSESISLSKQDLALDQVQYQEMKVDIPRVPFTRGSSVFKPKKRAGGVSGFEFPERRKKYKDDSYYHFERTHDIMSADAVMRMMFGGGRMPTKGRKIK